MKKNNMLGMFVFTMTLFTPIAFGSEGPLRDELKEILSVLETNIFKGKLVFDVIRKNHESDETIKQRIISQNTEIKKLSDANELLQKAAEEVLKYPDELVPVIRAKAEFSGTEIIYFNRDLKSYRIDQLDRRFPKDLVPEANQFSRQIANLNKTVSLIYNGENLYTIERRSGAIFSERIVQEEDPRISKVLGRLKPQYITAMDDYRAQYTLQDGQNILSVQLIKEPLIISVDLLPDKGFVYKSVVFRANDIVIETAEISSFREVSGIFIPEIMSFELFTPEGFLKKSEEYTLKDVILNNDFIDSGLFEITSTEGLPVMDETAGIILRPEEVDLDTLEVSKERQSLDLNSKIEIAQTLRQNRVLNFGMASTSTIPVAESQEIHPTDSRLNINISVILLVFFLGILSAMGLVLLIRKKGINSDESI